MSELEEFLVHDRDYQKIMPGLAPEIIANKVPLYRFDSNEIPFFLKVTLDGAEYAYFQCCRKPLLVVLEVTESYGSPTVTMQNIVYAVRPTSDFLEKVRMALDILMKASEE